MSTKDEDVGSENPYRTGGWIVVRDQFIQGAIRQEFTRESILKARFAFVPDTVWDRLGLPRGPVDGVPSTLEDFGSEKGDSKNEK